MARDQVFISYSHADSEWLERLQTMLAPLQQQGTLDVWADTRIQPGQVWKEEIQKALVRAKVAVLLVSPDFLASEFIQQNELPPLLEAARTEGLTILWVPIRPSLYKATAIAHFQAAYDPREPLSTLTPALQERALVRIAELLMATRLPLPPLAPVQPLQQQTAQALGLSVAKITAYGSGVVVVITLLVLAIFFPQSTPFPDTVFRILLALAAAGVAAFILGFIHFNITGLVRTGGAVAVFIIVYFFSPAKLLTENIKTAKQFKPDFQIKTVQVHFQGKGLQHGFFTGNSYIVTMTTPALLKDSQTVRITWRSENQDHEAIARTIRTSDLAPQAILLKYLGDDWPQYILPVRTSRSLKRGDRVAKYIELNDKQFGTVVDVGIETEVAGWSVNNTIRNALITSTISNVGDAGAPVVDDQGRVVAMIYGGSMTTTVCIPIEDIKPSFPEAFEHGVGSAKAPGGM